MKKNALSVSLLFSLLAATLVGCDVKAKKDDGKEVLFTINGENVTAEDLLGFGDKELQYNLLDSDEGVESVYETVYEAIAKANVERDAAIKATVAKKMKDWKEEVKSYATSNGVTQTSAKETKLEELGFDSEEELEESYYVAEQKTALVTQFETNKMEPTETPSLTGNSMVEKYVNECSPMVLKHILAKVSDSSTICDKGVITEVEAKELTNILGQLSLKANSFANVARDSESGDSSVKEGGNLGIIDKYTNYVAEFKQGVYASEIVRYHEENKTSDELKSVANRFGLNDSQYTDLFDENGVYADYEAESINLIALCSVLNYVADDNGVAAQKAYGNTKEADYDKQLYPLNILYNKELNSPEYKYLRIETNLQDLSTDILNYLREAYPYVTYNGESVKKGQTGYNDEITNMFNDIIASSYFKTFVDNDGLNVLGDDKLRYDLTSKYLVDENNHPFVFVKSSYGFHVISVTYSTVDQVLAGNGADAVNYFMYGKKADTTKTTYVTNTALNLGTTKDSTYKTNREKEIKNRVLNYMKGGFETVSPSDTIYQYAIYENYLNDMIANQKVTFNNDKVKEKINEHIKLAKVVQASKINKAQEEKWEGYIDLYKAWKEANDIFYAL